MMLPTGTAIINNIDAILWAVQTRDDLTIAGLRAVTRKLFEAGREVEAEAQRRESIRNSGAFPAQALPD